MSIDNTIIDLWHISRTALGGLNSSRYDRMIYIKNTLTQYYPELIAGYSPKKLWFLIEELTEPTRTIK